MNDTVPGTTRIARWKDNKKGALTLQFDDTSDSQAMRGVPNMAKRVLKGTWFANPGNPDHYQKYHDVWEGLAVESGQEFANHTFHHRGAQTVEEAEEEIGGCAKFVWNLHGEGVSKLLAFSAGGATSWGISKEDIRMIAEKYHSLGRKESKSMSTVTYGTTLEEMNAWADGIMNDGDWKRCHFHGIGWDGMLGMDTDIFCSFLDYLVTVQDSLWIDGWSRIYQYIKERDSATVTVQSADESSITLELTSEMDQKTDDFGGARLYQQPLTLITRVPDGWVSCKTEQAGAGQTVQAVNGQVMFGALPGGGTVTLMRI